MPCREDECFRRHPRPLAEQRGDDAILDALLHFHSLGAKVRAHALLECCRPAWPPLRLALHTHPCVPAVELPIPALPGWAQVLLVTQDKFLTQRASEHCLACVGAGQLVAAVQGALAAAPWSAEHDRELALLLFAPGYQQAALGISFASSHSEESYAAFAQRLHQPVQTVLLAATRLLAGDAATTAAAASCWRGAGAAAGGRQPALHGALGVGHAARAERRRASSSADQGGSSSESSSESGSRSGSESGSSGSGSDTDAESTGTPEPPEGTGSAAAAGEAGTDDEADLQRWHALDQEPQRRGQQARPAGALPEPEELRRLVGNPEYRQQVRWVAGSVTYQSQPSLASLQQLHAQPSWPVLLLPPAWMRCRWLAQSTAPLGWHGTLASPSRRSCRPLLVS